MLAASAAAPVDFDDPAAAKASGRCVPGQPPGAVDRDLSPRRPDHCRLRPNSRAASGDGRGDPARSPATSIRVTSPIVQSRQHIGTVYFEIERESASRRGRALPAAARAVRARRAGRRHARPCAGAAALGQPRTRQSRRSAGPGQCAARGADRGAGQGRGAAAPEPEDAGARPADRRHRARFQQSADGDPGLGRHAVPARPARAQAPAVRAGDRPGGDQCGVADLAAARVRAAPAAQARAPRPQRR